jgi:hypothetical protein
MKRTHFAGVLAAPLLMFALTLSGHADPTTCKDGTTSSSTGRGACSGHGGVQKEASGASATAPTAEPAAPTTCKDGTASATSGRGACSGHGGVQKAAKPKPTTSTTAPESTPSPATTPAASAKPSASKSAPTAAAGNTDPTGATAKCKDGTYSKAKNHRGACSHHGGVAEWLTGAQ